MTAVGRTINSNETNRVIAQYATNINNKIVKRNLFSSYLMPDNNGKKERNNSKKKKRTKVV